MMQIDNVILRNFCIIRLIRKIMVVMFKKNIYVPPFYRNLVIMMLMTTVVRHVHGIICTENPPGSCVIINKSKRFLQQAYYLQNTNK